MEEYKKTYIDDLITKSQMWRALHFKPMLIFLTNLKITANIITNIRLGLGVLGVCAFVFSYNYSLAATMLLVAILLDLFDGPLARFQNQSSDRGKFLDIFTDYVLYCFVLMLVSIISSHGHYVYYNLFIMPLLFLLGTIKKQEFKESDWIIKPMPYAGYLLHLVLVFFYLHWYFNVSVLLLDEVIYWVNVWSTILCIYYFIYIQLRWYKLKI